MGKSLHRALHLCLIVIFVFLALGGFSPQIVSARAFTTPPQINGIFNPDTIYPSHLSRLTINVYNPNKTGLTAVNWTDHLPDDLVVVDPADPTVTGCGDGYTLTAVPGANTISITGATTLGTTNPVNPGICSVTVSVTSFSVGNHTNIIHQATDGNVILGGVLTKYEYDANITLLVLPMTGPSIEKSFSPSTINKGETSQLVIEITNNDSDVELTDVTLHDSLPLGMAINNPVSTSLSGCGAGTLSPIGVGDTAINLTGGTIAVGDTCTITVRVAVTGTGTFTNTIHPADLTTFQKVTIPGDATADLMVKNISINKEFSLPNFQENSTISLSIQLTNPDTVNDLANVHFTDTMPSGISVVTTTAGTISGSVGCAGTLDVSDPGSLTLNNGIIPAGGSCTYTVSVTSSTPEEYTNTLSCAEITINSVPAGCASDSSTVTVYDTGLGLGVVKSFSDSNIEPGTSTRMTIAITAPADENLTNFSLTDHLPAGVTVFSPPNEAQNNCGGGTLTAVAGTSVITFTGGSITQGTTCNLYVDVTSSVYGPHTNIIHPADIDNTEKQNITGDVSATFTVRDISVSKSFASSIVGRNGVTKLTIQLTNNYATVLSDVAFTDTLPLMGTEGITIATPPNLTNTCNGSVTATAGSQTINLVGGSIPPYQDCTIIVDVQGISASATPPGDNFINTIAIGAVTGKVGGITDTKNWHEASDDITVGSPDFRINKKFDPILVTGDTASTMTITLVNTESSPVSGITFTDTLPNHMLLAKPASPSVGTCGGVITPAVNRKSFRFKGGALSGNSQCKLTIRAMMDVTGNLINTIPAYAVTTTQGMSNHQPTSATLTNLSSVSVTKKFSPNPVSPGGVSKITLGIKKIGIGIGLTGLGMKDDLLYGLTIANPPAATNTCGGTLSAPAGGTLIELTGGAMPIGKSTCTVTVNILVPDKVLRSGGYENCIPIGTVETDQGYTNVMEACDTLGSLFDPPSGYKVFDASGLPLLEWRMVWINDHNSANIDAQVSDTIPAGTTYVPGSLTCDPQGSSLTDICRYEDPPLNRIFWSGTIGPDRGATDEDSAANEVVITFRVTVPSTLNRVNNQGTSVTDRDGDHDFSDETTPSSNSNSNRSTWNRFSRRAGSGSGDSEAENLPASGFAPGVTTILPDVPAGAYQALPELQMEIPAIGLTSDIVGFSLKDKIWDVSWLGDNLGYLEETAFPTWNGNSVITGHVYDAQGKPGPFNKLHTLRYGDKVTVQSFGQTYTYEVRDVLTVAPDDFKAAFKHQENSWITLLTCQGYDPDTGTYRSRVLVRAVLVEFK